jgi:hypothetical protein
MGAASHIGRGSAGLPCLPGAQPCAREARASPEASRAGGLWGAPQSPPPLAAPGRAWARRAPIGWRARGRGGRWRRGGAGHPAAGPRPPPLVAAPRPRARRRTSPPPAATMSTGLRYKSKLATPGEPGSRPRARARLCPRRPLASHRISPSLPRPPAGPDADPTPTATPTPIPIPQRTSRYVRSAVQPVTHCGTNTAGAQARPRPRRPSSSLVPIINCLSRECRRA